MSRLGDPRLWFVLPQAASRLSALAVFALIANSTTPRVLGLFALVSAVGAAAGALGPAMVAKPLAATPEPHERLLRADMAISAATGLAICVGGAFAVAALLTDGLVSITLAAAAFAAGAGLMLESSYWARVFTLGPRPAGVGLTIGYVAQVVSTAVAGTALHGPHLVVVPVATLAVAAAVLGALERPSWSAARRWYSQHRGIWLPYVHGSAAIIVMVQAIPLTVTATVGLASLAVYRAVELAFGPTNLAIGVATNALLAREGRGGLIAAFRKGGVVLAGLAVINGMVLIVTPPGVLALFLGAGSSELRELAPIATLQRAALAVTMIGGTLLISELSARAVGLLNAFGAAATLVLLWVGLLSADLAGGFFGLALSEILTAILFAFLLRRASDE